MKKYHINVTNRHYLLFLAVFYLLLASPLLWNQYKNGIVDLQSALPGLAIPIGIYVFSYIVSLLMPIKLNERVIQFYASNGFRIEVDWDNMVAAQVANIFGVRFVLVELRNTESVLALPVSISNRKCFIDSMERFAGEDNPVVMSFRDIESKNT